MHHFTVALELRPQLELELVLVRPVEQLLVVLEQNRILAGIHNQQGCMGRDMLDNRLVEPVVELPVELGIPVVGMDTRLVVDMDMHMELEPGRLVEQPVEQRQFRQLV